MESSIITILSQEKNKMMKLEEITKELKVQDTPNYQYQFKKRSNQDNQKERTNRYF